MSGAQQFFKTTPKVSLPKAPGSAIDPSLRQARFIGIEPYFILFPLKSPVNRDFRAYFLDFSLLGEYSST